MATTDFKLRSLSDQLDERIPSWIPLVAILAGTATSLPVALDAGGGLLISVTIVLLGVVIALTAAFAAVAVYRRLTGQSRRTRHVPLRMTSAGLAGCPSPRPRR